MALKVIVTDERVMLQDTRETFSGYYRECPIEYDDIDRVIAELQTATKRRTDILKSQIIARQKIIDNT